jgi:hypothetical protein
MKGDVISSRDACAPKVQGLTSSSSCLTYELLVLLINVYNSTHTNKIAVLPKRQKQKMWVAIKDKLASQCGADEACWMEQPFVKQSAAYAKLSPQFKPQKPASWKANPDEWLNTYDILDVMKQYEESDKSYMFVGVFPVDFAAHNASTGTCVVQEMCQLDIATAWKSGVRKIGVVFNTDKSTGSGEHWISLYIGLDPKRKNFGVYFYDSVAMSPPREVLKFMRTIKKDIEALHPKHSSSVPYMINKVRRQYKNYNCGVYSMLFQIMMLKMMFTDVCAKMGYDDDVQKFRDILYRSK